MTMLPPVPGTPPGMPQVSNAQADAVPWAYIDLTLQGNRFTASINPPQTFVNGWLVAAPYGLSTVPVPAGPCRVDIYSFAARRRSTLEFAARPHQRVPVFYGPPCHVFVDGAIGYTKQPRPGLWILFPVCAFALASLLILALLNVW